MSVVFECYVGPYIRLELPDDYDWDKLHELNEENGDKFNVRDGTDVGGQENTAYLIPNKYVLARRSKYSMDEFSPPIELGLDVVRVELMEFMREVSKQLGVLREAFDDKFQVRWGILNYYV